MIELIQVNCKQLGNNIQVSNENATKSNSHLDAHSETTTSDQVVSADVGSSKRHRRIRQTRNTQEETLGFVALLATIPFLIAAARDLLTSKAIGLRGDLALEDAAVRQAIQLSRALGAYDRFGWHHLGPALFYILAPPNWLLGSGARSNFIAIAIFDAILVAAIVVSYRRLWGKFGAIGCAAGITTFVSISALTPSYLPSTNPLGFLGSFWNPYVSILPCLATVLFTVAALHGDTPSFGLAFLSGTVAIQTHLSCGNLIAVCWLSLLVCLVVKIRRRTLSKKGKSHALVAFLLAVIFWLPPIFEALLHRGGNFRRVGGFFIHSHPQGSFGWAIRAATSAATSSIPPVHQEVNGILGISISAIAVILGLIAPLVACITLGIRHRETLLLTATIATAGTWGLGVWSAFHLNGVAYSYLLAWVALAPVPCWIALIVFTLNHARRFSTMPVVVLTLTLLLGAVAGFAGPSFKALNDPQVLNTAQDLAMVLPRKSCVVFSTNRQDIPTFSFLTGVANELDRKNYRIQLQNHRVETTYSQFAPTAKCSFGVRFITAKPNDSQRVGFLKTLQGVSIFLDPVNNK